MTLEQARIHIGYSVAYTSPARPGPSRQVDESGVIDHVDHRWIWVEYGPNGIHKTHPDNLRLAGAMK
ncbi:hypothetical protein G4X40_19905 [Rhodococcus sp. D2-41]|uniref:hypothetical protein n=1 Tax=Speluncibacter jeojiensis TaxID=2710754 RepID=UPI00240FD883|nr:hypothetical protein [Rhodococcus sp. D2-41]MDG3012408.1 hypothetical protein [Rhodococcus sp. D2-41]